MLVVYGENNQQVRPNNLIMKQFTEETEHKKPVGRLCSVLLSTFYPSFLQKNQGKFG